MDIARAVAERQHRRDPVPPPGFGSSVRVSSPMHVLAGHGYVGMIYGRGAQVLADLKREIGEEKFLNGMRAHFAARRNGIATTRDFMNTMNEAAGRDLTEWFSQHQVVAVEPSANEHLDPNTEL